MAATLLRDHQVALTTAITEASKATAGVVGATVEVEARIQDTLAVGSRDGITPQVFERIRKRMETTPSRKLGVQRTIDYTIGGKRYTVAATTGGWTSTIITKNRVWHIDLDSTAELKKHGGYPVRIAVSTEIQQQGPLLTSLVGYEANFTLKRTKDRWSYILPLPPVSDESFRVDLTQSIQESKGQRPVYQWEVEIESLKIPLEVPRFEEAIDFILKMYYDTRILYTLTTRTNLITAFNTLLQAAPSHVLNRDVLVQARNLKKRDCVWGGLLGGAIGYAVTPKANGVRRQLFSHESGLWLVYPPLEINLVVVPRNNPLPVGIMMDGEWIPPNRRRAGAPPATVPYYYLPFDMMLSHAKRINEEGKEVTIPSPAIQRLSLFERLRIRDQICDRFNVLIGAQLFPLSFGVAPYKAFYPLGKSVSEFERVVAYVKNLLPTLPYETDADSVVFTPIEAEYNPRSDVHPLHERRLSVYPDTCKFKEWRELTVDVRLEWTSEKDTPGKLWVNRIKRIGFNDRKSFPVEWEGSVYNPLDLKTQIDWKSLEAVPTTAIIELGPKLVGENIVMSLVQVRTDKIYPNSEEVANDVWDDINNPLTYETLEGKTITLAIEFHKRLKQGLLNEIPEEADVVDIGTGWGGDAPKMRHVHHVLAVEPNPANFVELQRRLNLRVGRNPPLIKKFSLLQAGGEESDRIIAAARTAFGWGATPTAGRRKPLPLYITMMLSLSFFWKDQAMLNALARTLQGLRAAYRAAGGDEDVHFIFMTIEGTAVRNVMKRLGTNFQLGQATFKFSEPNMLRVHIADSIVSDQDEYLVDLPDLVKAASLQDMKTAPAIGEKFLSDIAQVYTSMYVTGTAIVGESKIEPVLPLALPIPQVPIMSAEYKELAPLADNVSEALTQVFLPDPNVPIKLPTDSTQYYRVGVPPPSSPDGGNSFFHALLKVTRPQYNRAPIDERRLEAKKMRADLTQLLSVINKDNYPTEADVLATLYGGVDPRASLPPTSIGATLPLNTYYYTLQRGGLQRAISYDRLATLLRSSEEVPASLVGYITEIIYCNIDVVKLTPAGELKIIQSFTSSPPRVMLKELPVVWRQPTFVFFETNKGTYEPIGYHGIPSKYDSALAFNFDSNPQSFSPA